MLRVRIRFIKSCNNFKLIPPHLEMYKRYEKNLCFFHDSSKKRLNLLTYEHVRMVLRVELDDAYRQLASNSNMIFITHKKIMKLLPWFVANRFFVYQDRNRNTKWNREINRVNKKVEWLIAKRNDNIKKDIKPIKYYYTENNRNEFRFSRNNDANSSNVINVAPDSFELNKSLNKVHNNWFVNLSKKTIPDEVKLLLQLGEEFSLPIVEKDKEKTIVEFIKCIEKNIHKEVDSIGSQIRNQSIRLSREFLKNQTNLTIMKN